MIAPAWCVVVMDQGFAAVVGDGLTWAAAERFAASLVRLGVFAEAAPVGVPS